MTNEELIEEIEAQRSIMIEVSTGGYPKIRDLNDEYKSHRQRIRDALSERDIPDPNPYFDLWRWYDKWSSGDLSTYKSRRQHVSEFYDPLIESLQPSGIEPKPHAIEEPEQAGIFTLDELRELIRQPESGTLEFKIRVPPPSDIAKLVSSFVNTDGGTLIVGVKEGGEIVGVNDPKRAQRLLQRAVSGISPSVAIESQILTLNGKDVLVVKIHKGHKVPYLVDGGAFQRIGDRTIPLTSTILFNNIQERATTLDDVLSEVRRLSSTIEQLNKELIAARSWRAKIPILLVGGVIGAVISVVLAFLLGLV